MPLTRKPCWVYVAGPYARDPEEGTRRAVVFGVALRAQGDQAFVPIIPHLFHYANAEVRRPEPFWLAWDIDLLLRCDALVRLPGASAGADTEVAAAKALGIPVAIIEEGVNLQDAARKVASSILEAHVGIVVGAATHTEVVGGRKGP